MKITLRKRDSVISAVLFIYNIYRELKGSSEIPLNALMGMLQRFDKSEASIRTALSRMTKSGILESRREAGDTVYALTQGGTGSIDEWGSALARFFKRQALRHGSWERHWHLLSIPGFNKSDYENQPVVDELKECGLREFAGGVWAAPYPVDGDLIAGLQSRGFHWIIVRGTLDTDMDFSAWLAGTCELDILKEKYAQFLHSADIADRALAKDKGAALLPVLFELGWDFYDAATADPVMPKVLLPEWYSDKAAARMKELRPQLLAEIAGYLEKIGLS